MESCESEPDFEKAYLHNACCKNRIAGRRCRAWAPFAGSTSGQKVLVQSHVFDIVIGSEWCCAVVVETVRGENA